MPLHLPAASKTSRLINSQVIDRQRMKTSSPTLERRRLHGAPSTTPTPALFLDRDGVIIEDRHHIRNPDHVQLCHGARPLISLAHQSGWPVVVITNQSGISRGLLDWEDYEKVTDRMLALLGPEGPITAIYANGHGPDAPPMSWRKPSPAMLHQAAVDLQLDLARSVLIGDRLSDLQAGEAAGLAAVCHVLSGHGERERQSVEHWGEQRQTRRASEISTTSLLLLNNLESFPTSLLESQTACLGMAP